jgi:hypothetical protein
MTPSSSSVAHLIRKILLTCAVKLTFQTLGNLKLELLTGKSFVKGLTTRQSLLDTHLLFVLVSICLTAPRPVLLLLIVLF